MIYLDNAATTFKKPERVYEAMDEAARTLAVNAGRGSYSLAGRAADVIGQTRELVRKTAGAEAGTRTVFTPSATVAMNMIIGGLPWRAGAAVYVSPYEHNAVIRTLYGYRERMGYTVEELPLEPETGELDLHKTEYLFSMKKPACVFMTHVSNVTGYILPVEKTAELAHTYGGRVVADLAQSMGEIPVQGCARTCDYLVFAGHKALHGPFGVGGFLQPSEECGGGLRSVLFGGTGSDSLNTDMPEGRQGFEPGSPNITAIAGLKAALEELAEQDMRLAWQRERRLMERLIRGLEAVRGVTVYKAPRPDCQAGVVSFNIRGYRSVETGVLLDSEYGIAVRTGYHCAPLIHRYLDDGDYGGTVRVSPDRYTAEADVDELLRAVAELAAEEG